MPSLAGIMPGWWSSAGVDALGGSFWHIFFRHSRQTRGTAHHQRYAALFHLFTFVSNRRRASCRPLAQRFVLAQFWTINRSAGTQASTSHRTPQGTPVTKAHALSGGSKPSSASPARPSNFKAAAGHSPSIVRKNACTKYEEALVKAAEKLSTAGLPPDTEVGQPAQLAEQIELACHTAFGASHLASPSHPPHHNTLGSICSM